MIPEGEDVTYIESTQNSSKNDVLVKYKKSDMAFDGKYCGFEDAIKKNVNGLNGGRIEANYDICKRVRIAVEFDQNFQACSNDHTFFDVAFNQTQAVYLSTFNLSLEICYSALGVSYTGGNVYDLLDDVELRWQTAPPVSIAKDIVHLVSGKIPQLFTSK